MLAQPALRRAGALISRGEVRLELRIEAQEFQHYHYWLYRPVVDTALGLPASVAYSRRVGSGVAAAEHAAGS